MRHAVLAGKLEQVQSADDVSLVIKLCLCQRGPNTRPSREVNYLIKAVRGKNAFQLLRIANVAFYELDVGRTGECRKVRPLYLRRIEIVQVVNDDNSPIPASEQVFTQVRANKTGSASQKNGLLHDKSARKKGKPQCGIRKSYHEKRYAGKTANSKIWPER